MRKERLYAGEMGARVGDFGGEVESKSWERGKR